MSSRAGPDSQLRQHNGLTLKTARSARGVVDARA